MQAASKPPAQRDAIAEAALRDQLADSGKRLDALNSWYLTEVPASQGGPMAFRSFAPRLLSVVLYALTAGHGFAQTDPLTEAKILNEQVGKLYRQGDYAAAIPVATRVLEIREQALGPDHPDVAGSLNNLALLYRQVGRYGDVEPLYRRALAIRERAFGPDHPGVANILSNLAELYRAQGRYAEAEPPNKRALAIREKVLGPDHADVATSLNNLAALYVAEGRYVEAEPAYKRALAIAEQALGADHPDVANSLSNLAQLYQAQGRYAEAESPNKRALVITEKVLGPDHPDVAVCLNNLAGLYQAEGRYAEAEPLFRRALAIRERALGPGHPDVATTLNNLALLYRDQGRYAEAEPPYQRALAINEKALGSDHPAVATNLNNLGELYQSQGRSAEAEPYFRRALAIWEKALGPDHPMVAYSLDHIAGMNRAQGRIDRALENSRRAIGIVTRHLADGASQRSGGAIAEQRQYRGYFMLNVSLAYAVGDGDAAKRDGMVAESFQVAQWAQASSAGRAVAGMAARFATGSDAIAARVRERQDLSDRWQRLDAAAIKVASRAAAERDPAAEAAPRRNLAAVTRELDALDETIARDFPNFAELSNPKPLAVAAAQALLAPDEALLVYLAAPRETWLWVLRSDRAAMHRIDIGAKALAIEVSALRGRLDPDLNPTLKPFEVTRAYALHQKILAPATKLLEGARQVFVVPDGALESLPIGVLVTKPAKADPDTLADHRDVAWFARDHAVIVLPSVGSLKALRQFTANGRASSPFVGIGNPTLEGQPGTARGVKIASLFRGAVADVAEVRKLDPLPETADELRAVAKSLGAGETDLYLADRATEPNLRGIGLDRYRIIEFATHGLMSGNLQGLAEPALVLTPPAVATQDNDGLLTASKVATLKLNADWVVLSACNTAAADGTPDAGGLSGLAKAFFYAGARSLLVSHWSVPSQATVKLITGAFDALKKDPSIGRAEALRRAEMAMLDPSNPPEFAHPLAWAPFVLAGEGGAGR